MKTYALPRKTLLLWRIRIFICLTVLLLVLWLIPLNWKFTVIIGTIFICLFLAAFFWYLPKFIKSCRITVINDSVIIKRGVIIENIHILPFSRLIHTLTVQTPLAKLLSLNTVLFKAARFRVFVPELSSEDAESLVMEINSEARYEKDL